MNSELPTCFLLYNSGKKKEKEKIWKFSISWTEWPLMVSNFHERPSYYYQNNVSGQYFVQPRDNSIKKYPKLTTTFIFYYRMVLSCIQGLAELWRYGK